MWTESSACGRNWGLLAFRAVGCGGRIHVLNFISRASDSNLAALLCGQLRLEEARKALETGRKLNRVVEAPSKPPGPFAGRAWLRLQALKSSCTGSPVSRKKCSKVPALFWVSLFLNANRFT